MKAINLIPARRREQRKRERNRRLFRMFALCFALAAVVGLACERLAPAQSLADTALESVH